MTVKSAPKTDPHLVEVSERTFLMIDGRGDPNGSEEFQDAVQALYTISYGVKFRLKRSHGVDRKVGTLEGLWWAEDERSWQQDRSAWRWTLMIEQPDEVTPEVVQAVAREKGLETPMRLERLAEGLAAEILHVGPFAEEPPTIERLHGFIADRGLRRTGRHHEIYLSDLRRTAPERLRTIIRQPVEQ